MRDRENAPGRRAARPRFSGADRRMTVGTPVIRSPAVRLRTFCAVIGAGILTVSIAACGGGDASLGSPDAAAMTIGGVTITNAQVERRADSLAKAQVAQTAQSGTTADLPAKDSEAFWDLRREAAQQLRDEQVFAILAKRCGAPCAVTKAEVNSQIAGIITQQFGGSRSEFNSALAAQGMTLNDLQDSFRASLREERLTSRVTRNVTFTESQAQAYYTANTATYRTPAEKRVSHILLGTKKVADQLRPQLTAENFAQMAKEHSLDPAAKTTGGDLGSVTGSGLFPEMLAVVKKLKPGQISQPVQTQFGWSILMVRQTPATTKSFDSVKDAIMSEQLQVAQTAATQKWRDTVVKKVQDSVRYVNAKIRPDGDETATTSAVATTTAP